MNPVVKDIIVCSTSYYEYDRRVNRILSVLLENDFSIDWISRSYNNKIDSKLKIKHRIISPIFKRGFLFYLEANAKIFLKLLMSKAKVIYAIDTDTLFSAYIASKLTRKILVFDAHEIFHEVPELINKPIKKSIWKSVSKILYPKIKNKFTVNQSLKDIFKKEFNTDFKVVRNVPFLNTSALNKPKLSNKKMVYLGVLNEGRGIEIAIESLVTLKKYKLVLIGDGDLTNALKLLCKELNVSNRVSFLGYRNPEEIDSILRESSIGLNLLDPMSDNYKYSLANKFFDYMHADLPSINMNFQEYSNIISVNKVAIMASNYSVRKLIDSIHRLEDEKLYSEIQQNCALAKEVYNWQIESKKIIDIFTEATNY